MTNPLKAAIRWADAESGLAFDKGTPTTAHVSPKWGIDDNWVRRGAHILAKYARPGSSNLYIAGWRGATSNDHKYLGKSINSIVAVDRYMQPQGTVQLQPYEEQTEITSMVPRKLTLTPNLVDYSWWDNRASDTEREYQASLSQSVEETIELGWERSFTVGVSQSISVKAGEGPLEATSETSVSVEASVGQSRSESRSVSLGVESDVQGEVPAGQLDAAVLTSSKGDLIVDAQIRTQVQG